MKAMLPLEVKRWMDAIASILDRIGEAAFPVTTRNTKLQATCCSYEWLKNGWPNVVRMIYEQLMLQACRREEDEVQEISKSELELHGRSS
jgi:hypothetical protein